MLDIKERIEKIMLHEGLSSSRFAESIGIQRSAMSHLTSGRNNPSLDVVLKILERYPAINPEWLLKGKGEMFRCGEDTKVVLAPNSGENPYLASSSSENCAEFDLNTGGNLNKPTVIEKVSLPEKPAKSVSKIMIFYSDNTFDTFVPEKSAKE